MKESKAPSLGRTPAQKFFDKWQGLFYLIPWIIGFVVFKAIPFGQSLYYSFTDMDFFNGIHQYGIMNYVDAFTTPKITKALITTFKYSFITVPLKLVFALFIAYILNFKIACVNVFRTVYYIPSILGGSVAIAVLWKAVFRDDGLVNTLIRMLTFGHFQGPSWLSDPGYALWIICFLRIWQFGSAMVLFLAALKGVPADLYEAATIDGAGKWNRHADAGAGKCTRFIYHNSRDHVGGNEWNRRVAMLFGWMKSLIFYLLLATIVTHMAPSNQYKQYIRYFIGLVVIVLLASPLKFLFEFGSGDLQELLQEIEHVEGQESVAGVGGSITDYYGMGIREGLKKELQGYSVEDVAIITDAGGELLQCTIYISEAKATEEMEKEIKKYISDVYNLEDARIYVVRR